MREKGDFVSKLNRRKFIKTSSLGIIGAGLIKKSYLSSDRNELKDEIPRISEYNLLGRTGFRASDIGCGNTLDEAILKSLIEKGVNYIDTSEIYNNGRSEIAIGKAIKEFDRKSLFITTKVNPPLYKYDGVLARARKCLDRLDTGYIDCLMIHWRWMTKKIYMFVT
jgi:diketogulonate reductase-like aldo/keto reductase